MVQALRIERVRQRAHHVVLAYQGIERARPPLAGQYQISHGRIVEPVARGRRAGNTKGRRNQGANCHEPTATRSDYGAPLGKPVGETYSGTDPKRLWMLRSRT